MDDRNPFSLEGLRVLVTGGTRGLGRAIALRCARAGAAVQANYVRNEDAATSLLEEASAEGLDLDTFRADLTLPKGLDAAVERLDDDDGRIPAIVHCAATGIHRPFDQLTRRHWDWTFALNVRALFELVRLALPKLREGSTILAMSSEGAARAIQDYSLVGASKGGLESLCRHMARELAPRGVRVNVLSAGSVPTEAWDAFPDKESRLESAAQRTPTGRLVTPDEVAHVAQFLCSQASSGIIGQSIVVDGGKRIVE